MISWLSGVVLEKDPPHVVVDVQGVGYALEVSYSTFAQLADEGASVALFVYTHVREDALLLFGFAEKQERQLFLELIRINGVGAKLALTILSGMRVDEFVSVIQAQDSARLTQLPGVGKKTADRLLLELASRLEGGQISVSGSAPAVGGDVQVLQALQSLGYSSKEAERMVQALGADTVGLSVSERVRLALRGMQ